MSFNLTVRLINELIVRLGGVMDPGVGRGSQLSG